MGKVVIRVCTAICVFSLILTGCSSVQTVHMLQPSGPALSQINESGEKKGATVKLVNGRSAHVNGLRVAPDSTSWIAADTQQLTTFPTSSVDEVVFVNRLRGAWEGLSRGAITGIALGTAVGLALRLSESVSIFEEEEKGESAGFWLIFGILGCPVGGGVGFIYGSIVGHRDIYHFGQMARAQAAMNTDEGVHAVELVCQVDELHLQQGAEVHGQTAVSAFLDSCRAYQYKRYAEVSTPPGNLHQILSSVDQIESWTEFAFTGIAFGNRWWDEDREVYGVTERGARGYLVIRKRGAPRVSIDLNLDGVAEVMYDGREATISSQLMTNVDRGPEGERVQWLVGLPGTNPREQARVWMYRDGAAFFVIVDAEGGGRNVCGRRLCIR